MTTMRPAPRRRWPVVRALIGVGALIAALFMGLAATASAADAPAPAAGVVMLQALPICTANSTGPCQDENGTCYSQWGAAGGTTMVCPPEPSPEPSPEPGCWTAAQVMVPCDSGECVQGQCVKECFDAAQVRVPCDSSQCVQGRDCTPPTTTTSTAKTTTSQTTKTTKTSKTKGTTAASTPIDPLGAGDEAKAPSARSNTGSPALPIGVTIGALVLASAMLITAARRRSGVHR